MRGTPCQDSQSREKTMNQTHNAYNNLELQPLAGEWRTGNSDRSVVVTNPYNGEALLEMQMANRDDLNAAFQTAEKAQAEWAAMPPAARAEIMLNAVRIF